MMKWLTGILPVLFLFNASVGQTDELELFLKRPVLQEKPSPYSASLSTGRTLDFSRQGYTHKIDLFPGIEVLDQLRLELPGVVKIAPPEVASRESRGKLLDHFPRIGFYVLLDSDTALYITERYEERQYAGRLVTRKDMLFLPSTAPVDLAITVLDKDQYHRRNKGNFELGFYGRLPFELDLGALKVRSEFSIGYDDHAEFMALLRVHLGE
jgi:hypothetical protein